MFSVREVPWHGLGAVLERTPATIAEAIEASGLGSRVEREPIAVDRGDAASPDSIWDPRCEEIPGYYATVRQETRQVLGIVGECYRIVQNTEAFEFVDQLLGSSLHFETAGSLNGGRRVWVLATLPEHVIVGGDPVRPYVLLMNSHDGSTAVIATTTPVRVVCQNTLNWGLSRARQRFSIRHTEQINRRVHEAQLIDPLALRSRVGRGCRGIEAAATLFLLIRARAWRGPGLCACSGHVRGAGDQSAEQAARLPGRPYGRHPNAARRRRLARLLASAPCREIVPRRFGCWRRHPELV